MSDQSEYTTTNGHPVPSCVRCGEELFLKMIQVCGACEDKPDPVQSTAAELKAAGLVQGEVGISREDAAVALMHMEPEDDFASAEHKRVYWRIRNQIAADLDAVLGDA